LAPQVRAWEVDGAWEVAVTRWQGALDVALRQLGKSVSNCSDGRKSAPWKIAVAVHLKHSTQASNRWLADQLQMGSAVAVSQYVSAFRHQRSPDQLQIHALTEKL